MKSQIVFFLFALSLLIKPALGQTDNFTTIRCEVHFDRTLRPWEGFGFNYVEEAQYRDIDAQRQDYGGFSYLNEKSRQEILQLIFGEDGLQPALIKMFLDPFHQEEEGGNYHHLRTTENMLYFVKNGFQISQSVGYDFQIITTLYGPPAYMTNQKVLRGRDFDPRHKEDLANYFIDWADFLVNEQQLPLKYISLHNEGDDWQRWPDDGGDSKDHYNHDYNMYWPPEMVVDFLKYLPKKLEEAELGHIGVTPGECYSWDRFIDYGYAPAIVQDFNALQNMSLVTSHGFMNWGWGRWNTRHTSRGIDMIRDLRPEMKSWVTSTSWGGMDTEFIRQIYSNIYNSKINALIPWAGIQRPELWVGGDPNAGSAIHVFDDGTYKVRKGYHFYKQVTMAGRPETAVCETITMDAEISIIAFAKNKSTHPDAFVVINMADKPKNLNIGLHGTTYKTFGAVRSKDDETELYQGLDDYHPKQGKLIYLAPPKSVTTFRGM